MDLAQRVVAAKGWTVKTPGDSLDYARDPREFYRTVEGVAWRRKFTGTYSPWLPDLSDPATLGCLLALVREAWGDKVVIQWGQGWWSVETDTHTWDNDNTPSLQRALVAALETAP